MGNYRGPRLTAEDFAQIAATTIRKVPYVEHLRAPVSKANDSLAPVVVGSGPVTWSTSLVVERWPTVIYDPNCYYAALGVSPGATREDLRRAYQALDGQSDPRLTYVMAQLLDPEVRRAYDSTPLGSFFYDNEVETRTRIQAADQVARFLAQGARQEDFVEVDPVEMAGMERSTMETGASQGWSGWSYYRWESWGADEGVLTRWRGLLLRRLKKERRGLTPRLAVGYCGVVPGGVKVVFVGGVAVAFLADDAVPTRRRAKRAVRDIKILLSQ